MLLGDRLWADRRPAGRGGPRKRRGDVWKKSFHDIPSHRFFTIP